VSMQRRRLSSGCLQRSSDLADAQRRKTPNCIRLRGILPLVGAGHFFGGGEAESFPIQSLKGTRRHAEGSRSSNCVNGEPREVIIVERKAGPAAVLE